MFLYLQFMWPRVCSRFEFQAALIKKNSYQNYHQGHQKLGSFLENKAIQNRDAAGISNPGGLAVMWWA